MEQVSINIPMELYKELVEEAGNVPVESYIGVLISRARRQRPRLVAVDTVDSFLEAIEPWKGLVDAGGMKAYGGAGGGTFGTLPNGRVRITANAWFFAMGPCIGGNLVVGEISERFSSDGLPNPNLIIRAKQTVVPWERVAPGELPLNDDDKAIFKKLNEVGERVWPALERLGVRRQDRLIPLDDAT